MHAIHMPCQIETVFYCNQSEAVYVLVMTEIKELLILN